VKEREEKRREERKKNSVAQHLKKVRNSFFSLIEQQVRKD
jgi:hypothetical protein